MTEAKNNEKNLEKKRERNYGIDLLRILSMFMVTLLHFSGHGGYKGNPDSGTVFYMISFFMVLCYGAVDIFALISGYVMYGSKIKYSRIISLWFQVACYSVALSAVEKKIFHQSYLLLGSFFPVLNVRFWYFSAYFFMFFFIPFFNSIVEKLSCKKLFSFLATGFIIFCVCSNVEKFFAHDMFGLIRGYSIMWLSFCYIFGAAIKKYQSFFYKFSNKVYIMLTIACWTLTYIGNVVLYDLKFPIKLRQPLRDFLLVYTSPTVFISSLCLLILFSRIKISHGKSFIKILSATSFSVYIIQTHTLIWDNFLCKYSTFFDASSALAQTGLVLSGSIAFYLAATVVDYLRIQIFRLLHIDTLSKLICKLLEKIINVAKKPLKKFIQG